MTLTKLSKSLAGAGPIFLTLPVFNRINQNGKGLKLILEFIEDLKLFGPGHEAVIPMDGGQIIISSDESLIDFTLEFISKENIKAELSGNFLNIINQRIPESVIQSIQGKELSSVIELPRAMRDLGQYQIQSVRNMGNSVLLDIGIKRIKHDKKTIDIIIGQVMNEVENERRKAA